MHDLVVNLRAQLAETAQNIDLVCLHVGLHFVDLGFQSDTDVFCVVLQLVLCVYRGIKSLLQVREILNVDVKVANKPLKLFFVGFGRHLLSNELHVRDLRIFIQLLLQVPHILEGRLLLESLR